MIRAAVSGVLIVIFFVLHNVNINQGLLQVDDILLFLLFTSSCILALFYGSNFLFRSPDKAAIFASWVTVIMLFFGNLQDELSAFTLTGRFTAMKYFLPACILSFLLLFVFLYLSKRMFVRAVGFLFTLGAALIVYELIMFISLPSENKNGVPVKLQNGITQKGCDSCKKPDIYFFLLDEYTGSTGLRNDFHYDNAWFESMLAARQFTTITEARSPYILTIYAMASMMNMNYMTDTSSQKISNNMDYQFALRAINNNAVCHYLADKGYAIKNLSPFDLPMSPSSFSERFNPAGISLLYYKTIYGRIKRDLTFMLRGKKLTVWNKAFNERIMSNNRVAMEEAIKPNQLSNPLFTYAHLFMPHVPFGFDSSGKLIPPSEGKTPLQDCDDYLQYLVYTNKLLIPYLDTLKKNTENGAVILVASDHGYRAGCGTSSSTAGQSVLMSYYLPAGYDAIINVPGTSNVESFRILFNAIFPE